MGIKIVTDSSAEISQEEAKKLGITVVPLKCIFGGIEYLDGIDLSPEDFYIKLAESKDLPTTSQPSPLEFEQAFREAQEAGDQVIAICIAESMSGTCQSARIASEICGGDIRVIDSGATTIGVQIFVRRAVQLVESGKTAEEIVNILEEEKKSICLFAVIDTLEYLHKGGRLSKASAFAGTMLNLKPIVSVIHGELKVAGKCRGLKKAYKEIFNFVESVGGIDFSKTFAIGYTGDRNRFDEFAQVCEQYFDGNKPITGSIGSVIGTHAGPGAVAVVFFKNEGIALKQEIKGM